MRKTSWKWNIVSIPTSSSFFYYYESMNYNFHVPSLKLTFSPLKRMVAIRSCPFGARLIFRGELWVLGGVLFMYPPGKQHIPPLEKENHLPNHLWVGICEFPGTLSVSDDLWNYQGLSSLLSSLRTCQVWTYDWKKHRRWGPFLSDGKASDVSKLM